MSGPNPRRCTECHGNPPRPRWEPYPVWAGAYGSDDEMIDPATRQGKAFAKFEARRKKEVADGKGRYRFLVGGSNRPEKRDPQDFTKAIRNGVSRGLYEYDLPNAELNHALAKLAWEELKARLKEPTLAPYVPGIIGMLECRSQGSQIYSKKSFDTTFVEEFLPEHLRADFSTKVEKITETEMVKLSASLKATQNRASKLLGVKETSRNDERGADYASVLQSESAINRLLQHTALRLNDFSFAPGRALIFETGTGNDDLMRRLWLDLHEDYPELRKMATGRNGCEKLKEESRRQLTLAFPKGMPKTTPHKVASPEPSTHMEKK